MKQWEDLSDDELFGQGLRGEEQPRSWLGDIPRRVGDSVIRAVDGCLFLVGWVALFCLTIVGIILGYIFLDDR